MSIIYRRLIYFVIGLMALATLTALVVSINFHSSPLVGQAENMEPFIQNMKAVCTGRFLLELPRTSVRRKGVNYQYAFTRVEVMDTAKNLQAFTHAVSKIEADYLGRRTGKDNSFLVFSEKLRNDFRWLVHHENDYEIGGGMQAYVLKESTIFKIVREGWSEEDKANFRRELVALEPHLHFLAPDTVPSGRGFCMSHGYIDKTDSRGETAGEEFTIPEIPGLYVLVSTQVNDEKILPGILDKEASIIEQMGSIMDDIKTIRKGRRTIHGMEAQEWIVKVPPGGYWEYKFELDIPGKPNSHANPRIGIVMKLAGKNNDSGDAEPVTFSESEALLLWDAITNSLRLRPGAL